jgi:hypothetical protein
MADRFENSFTSKPIDEIGPGSKFMEDFERIKLNFENKDQRTQSIALTMKGIDYGKVDRTLYNFEEEEVNISWYINILYSLVSLITD